MSYTESLPSTLPCRDRASVAVEGRSNVVWVDGERDASNSYDLATALARASELDEVDVVLDLSRVAFMDASTIGAIISARNYLQARSLSLRVRAPSPAARHVLELCKLTSLVEAEPLRECS